MYSELAIARAERLLERSEDVGALRYGDFTLTSGAKSSFYFDGRLLSTDPESVSIITEVMLDLIEAQEIDSFGGPAVGAVPIVGSVMMGAYNREMRLRGFFVRSEAKQHGMGKQLEGHLRAGDRAAVYDDTISTAGSLLNTVDAVTGEGASVRLAACVLHRHEPGSERLDDRGIPVFNMLTVSQDGRVEVDYVAIREWSI